MKLISKLAFIALAFWLLLAPVQLQNAYSQKEGFNWPLPAYDIRNTGFNPQTVITKDNVQDLELKWVYQAPERPTQVLNARVAFGIHATPIVVSGILYFVTESNKLIALNTNDGSEFWSYQYDLAEVALSNTWSFFQTQNAISYVDDKIWMQTNDCNVHAFEPLRGGKLFELLNTCSDIPGNDGSYVGHYSPIFYKGILITRASAGGGGGRGFIAGYDSFNGRLLWRWFVIPPTGGDPDWDEKSGASKGNINPYPGDWGQNKLIGGGSVFSLIALDEEKGIIYFPTGAPDLSYDASLRPGPNLFASSVVALNAETGQLVWYYQTTPHDIQGHEPARSVILADAEVKGQKKRIVMAVDKADHAYILDAATGQLLLDPIGFGAEKMNLYNTNKGNSADMTLSQEVLVAKTYCPGQAGGSTVPAFAYNTLFVASQTWCSEVSKGTVIQKGITLEGYRASPAQIPPSSSVSAIDVSNGRIKWTFPMKNRYQGGITVSGGVAYLVDLAGVFYAIDADTGALLKSIPTNGDGNTGVTIASDIRGEPMVFIATGGLKSGVITALGLESQPSDSQLPFDLRIVGIVVLAAVITAVYLVALRMYNKRKKV